MLIDKHKNGTASFMTRMRWVWRLFTPRFVTRRAGDAEFSREARACRVGERRGAGPPSTLAGRQSRRRPAADRESRQPRPGRRADADMRTRASQPLRGGWWWWRGGAGGECRGGWGCLQQQQYSDVFIPAVTAAASPPPSPPSSAPEWSKERAQHRRRRPPHQHEQPRTDENRRGYTDVRPAV